MVYIGFVHESHLFTHLCPAMGGEGGLWSDGAGFSVASMHSRCLHQISSVYLSATRQFGALRELSRWNQMRFGCRSLVTSWLKVRLSCLVLSGRFPIGFRDGATVYESTVALSHLRWHRILAMWPRSPAKPHPQPPHFFFD